MSTTKQNSLNASDEISTDNLSKDFGPTIPLKDVAGKPMHVCGRQTWRGKPSPQSSQDKIGEDGKEDKFSCQTTEEFEGNVTKDGNKSKVKANSVYITALMYRQLGDLAPDNVSIDILFKEGKTTGVLYGVKRKSLKAGGSVYWSFVNKKQLAEVDIVD